MLARVLFACLLLAGVLGQGKKPSAPKKTQEGKRFVQEDRKPATYNYELCNAVKAWHFVGPAFKYQKSIRLMSDRLLNIRSMGLLVTPIEGGESWNLTLRFILKGDEKHHGEGFGLWLSNKEMFSDLFEHLTKSKTKDHAFGYGGSFNGVGFGVLHNRSGSTTDSYYVSRTYDGMVSRSGFIFNCR